ncbi:MAG: ABC transporter substrate-binding protein, partial [Geminicoccaceae bacterium]|nr:ABC transporter substrate-binding protein [Geminicoccaceae bacterium]
MKSFHGLAAGFAALAAIAVAQSASAETDISFAIDWKFEGPAAPFTVALDDGFYAEEGLNVSIDSGSGSSQTIPRIATGNYDIGTGDFASLVKFKDQNPDAAVQAVDVLGDDGELLDAPGEVGEGVGPGAAGGRGDALAAPEVPPPQPARVAAEGVDGGHLLGQRGDDRVLGLLVFAGVGQALFGGEALADQDHHAARAAQRFPSADEGLFMLGGHRTSWTPAGRIARRTTRIDTDAHRASTRRHGAPPRPGGLRPGHGPSSGRGPRDPARDRRRRAARPGQAPAAAPAVAARRGRRDGGARGRPDGAAADPA